MTADTLDKTTHPQTTPAKDHDKDKDATKDKSKDKDKDKEEPYEEGPQYEEGDPAKGRIDPEKVGECVTVELIPMRDRRAYLLDQAAKNESANDEVNARQVELNKRLPVAQAIALDPDRMRDESMENTLAELEMHDPDHAEKAKRYRQQVLRERAAAAGTPGEHRVTHREQPDVTGHKAQLQGK